MMVQSALRGLSQIQTLYQYTEISLYHLQVGFHSARYYSSKSSLILSIFNWADSYLPSSGEQGQRLQIAK